jgi:hemerythrin-like metal-binding protein
MSEMGKNDYRIGVKIMDYQHQELINLIAMADNLLKSEEGHTKAGELIQGIKHYIKVHFTMEEELMRIYEVPDRDRHIKLHNAFKDQVARMEHAAQAGELETVKSALTLLQKWAIEHILKVDQEVAKFLNSKGLN